MRKTAMFCIASILAGCAQTDGKSLGQTANSDFKYDERDAIPSSAPLASTGVNQHPVVGTKKVLVTVVNWAGENILNETLIKQHTLSNDPDSWRSYILAASNGKLTLDGQVVSLTSGPRPEQCKSGTHYPMALAISEGEKAARAHGLNPADFDYVVYMIDCFGGASAQMPGKVMGVYGQSPDPHVYKHEFGHNLGYNHGSTYTECPKNGDTITAPVGCSTVGLGDTGDTVSGGGTLYPANNRWYSGWLNEPQYGVIERTGIYGLGVLGKDGPQLYLINRKTSPTQLALELRQPTPFDNFPPNDNRVTGVWVRYTQMRNSLLNTQLDATPETATTADPTLKSGRTLKDQEAGITIKVCSVNHFQAVVAVAVNHEQIPQCLGPIIALPTVITPAAGAPAQANPIVFSGTGYSGAATTVEYKMAEAQTWQKTNVEVDAKGNWQVPLPPLPAGTFNSRVSQVFGGKVSLYNPRNFEIRP